jgi:hypothetical protein
VRTEEDIMEEHGLADYDSEQVNKPSPVFQAWNLLSGSRSWDLYVRIKEGGWLSLERWVVK